MDVAEDQPYPEPRHGPAGIETEPGWAAGLDGYGGIALLSTGETEYGHNFAGGIARVRWQYVQAGATFEITDVVLDQWHAIGGFVGGFLPIRGWVDFELDAGLQARTYANTDRRYGPNGYEFTVPSLTFRLGVSDRSSNEDTFAARFGGQIVTAIDLQKHVTPWRYQVGDNITEGDTTVGGVSVGLMLVIGLDVAGQKLEL